MHESETTNTRPRDYRVIVNENVKMKKKRNYNS